MSGRLGRRIAAPDVDQFGAGPGLWKGRRHDRPGQRRLQLGPSSPQWRQREVPADCWPLRWLGVRVTGPTGEYIGTADAKHAGHDMMLVPTGNVVNQQYVGGGDNNSVEVIRSWSDVYAGEYLRQPVVTSARTSETCCGYIKVVFLYTPSWRKTDERPTIRTPRETTEGRSTAGPRQEE